MSSRALAIGGRILLILLTAIGLLWPLAGSLFSTTAGAADDPVVITELRSAFTVAADGHMAVTEQITADFPGDRHGIFRYWDVSDPSDPSARHIPTIREITVDGAPAQFETYWEDGRRFLVAKIGDPDVYLDPGRAHLHDRLRHRRGDLGAGGGGCRDATRRRRARTPGIPARPSTGTSSPRAGRWPIEKARIAISLPSPSGAGRSAPRGPAAGRDRAGSRARAPTDLVLTATDIPPRTGMTVRATMAAPAPDREALPWSVRWDPILGRSVPALIAVLAHVRRWRSWPGSRGVGSAGRTPPGSPSMYAPPEGLGPVQTVYMATESHGPAPLIATILYLADRGFVTLENPAADTWRIIGRAQDAQWGVLDPGAQAVGRSLGIRYRRGDLLRRRIDRGRQDPARGAAGAPVRGGRLGQQRRPRARGAQRVPRAGGLGAGPPPGRPGLRRVRLADDVGPALRRVRDRRRDAAGRPGSAIAAPPPDGSCGRRRAGSSGCSPRRRRRTGSTSRPARTCSSPTCRTRWPSAWPTSGPRSTG